MRTIRSADGATITVETTSSGLFGRLRVDYHGIKAVAILDRDDLEALADACTVLAEELAEGKQGGEGGQDGGDDR